MRFGKHSTTARSFPKTIIKAKTQSRTKHSHHSSSYSIGLNYETLTKWYLYRIAKFENDKDKMLNAIVAINPEAVKEAKRDKNKSKYDHAIYGIPILKRQYKRGGHAYHRGTHLLRNNIAADAFIITQIKDKGAIILGKTNPANGLITFSSWVPMASAVGGQTLNPWTQNI
jgi:amidase